MRLGGIISKQLTFLKSLSSTKITKTIKKLSINNQKLKNQYIETDNLTLKSEDRHLSRAMIAKTKLNRPDSWLQLMYIREFKMDTEIT